jgi:ABC-type branched-subunit amino acid transport system ATPase component
MTDALRLENVTYRVGGMVLTRDVSLALKPGERRGLLGPNGAGKTTLINLIAGVSRPDSGRILLGDADITDWPAHRRARAGVARTFQITNLLPTMTVEENLAIAVGAELQGRRHPFRRWRSLRGVWDRVDEIMESSQLTAIARKQVAQLPYGEQRKLEVAVAVARSASVVLLDEPGAGLTAGEAEELIELVFGLGDDVAVILIDHDLDLVLRLATQVTVLELGAVVAEGTPEEMRESDVFRQVYSGGMASA